MCVQIGKWIVAWGGRSRSQGRGKAENTGHGRGMTGEKGRLVRKKQTTKKGAERKGGLWMNREKSVSYMDANIIIKSVQ